MTGFEVIVIEQDIKDNHKNKANTEIEISALVIILENDILVLIDDPGPYN
ncbi:2591_t:CDS:2 [Funneliformis geosporum]|uniref:11897_t:CDS:1 n=1 Tax=Funneliformis geosporum TaxID=1117311 RepID=A0A9W4SGV1_9GLOM|nr:11897_t:CDS:2 [Funneliformis geosporum]CAI2172667.1 2591_t:CDS:2 [Funneliformis geosporum]